MSNTLTLSGKSQKSLSQGERGRFSIKKDKMPNTPEYLKDLRRKLRKKPTNSEKILWEALRNKKFKNLKFRRQHPIGGYIVDFCCEEYKIVIEIDGAIHDFKENKEYDIQRQQTIESEGYGFLRVRVDDVENNLQLVIKKLSRYIPSPFGRGTPDE